MPVTGFDVTFSRPLAGGKSWGDAGPYEELRGTLHFAIDPGHPVDERITDVTLAPRNSEGLVEFSADCRSSSRWTAARPTAKWCWTW